VSKMMSPGHLSACAFWIEFFSLPANPSERVSDGKVGEAVYKNRNVPEKHKEHHSNSAQE
jgi:hypothetical protein